MTQIVVGIDADHARNQSDRTEIAGPDGCISGFISFVDLLQFPRLMISVTCFSDKFGTTAIPVVYEEFQM